MKFLLRWFAGAALLAAVAPVFSAEEKAKGAEMARVAIIKYVDKTGTKNFEYMPGSLQEAIGGSMHQKFEFTEADLTKVEPIVAQVRAKNKGVIGAKEAAEICRLADIDILIYGDFTYNKEEQEIEIHTNISLGSTDKFRLVPAVENRVDSTIFQAADKVATDIVAEITKVALEQQQAKGKAELDKKKKTQLEKTEKSTTWADINWNFQISAGPLLPLINRANARINMEGSAGVNALYRLRQAWHVGVLSSLAGIKTNSTTTGYTTDLTIASAAIGGGYFWDISPRWRATTLIGAGYYYGKYNSYNNCTSPNCSSGGGGFQSENFVVKNPFFTARAGIHFLIFSFFAVGLEGEYRMYYDAKPVNAVGGALTLSVVF